jgi:hypothetical protein
MSKLILEICGVFHCIFGAVQIYYTYLFAANPYKANFGNREITAIYGVWSCLVILYFAYISIFHSKDVLTSKLGKSLLVFVALFYFARAIEEVIFIEVGVLVYIIPCLAVAIVNIALLFLPPPPEKRPLDLRNIS